MAIRWYRKGPQGYWQGRLKRDDSKKSRNCTLYWWWPSRVNSESYHVGERNFQQHLAEGEWVEDLALDPELALDEGI